MAGELTLQDVVGEQPSTQPTPEATGEGSQSDQTQSQPQPSEQVTPYTDDEMTQLLESDGKIDSKRLTPSQKLIQKSFEKHFQKRFQQLGQERREVAIQRPQNIFEEFDRHPDFVMNAVRQAIIQVKTEDPFSQKVIQLEALKDTLTDRRITMQNINSQSERIISDTLSSAEKMISNLDQKKPLLEEFAKEQFGYTDNELLYFTDPTIHGKEAVLKFVKTINTAYDKANPGKSKETTLKPNQLERSSTAKSEDGEGKDPSKWSYEKYRTERMAGRLK